MNALTSFAQSFIGLFQEGGKTFLDFAGGILPTLIALMTAVNALVKLVGEERVNKIAKVASKYTVLRYTVMPFLAVFFLTNPMCYTLARFLPEKYKPALYDATSSFLHPVVGLFPHCNPAELFIYMGIAQGIQKLGLPLGQLAIRYFLAGLAVIFIRGVITEKLTIRMLRQKDLIL